jgi:hypothetical protein
MENAVAGEAAVLVLEINPSMALYRHETITVDLPDFTACGIASRMTASCTLHSAVVAEASAGNYELGSSFIATWFGDREQIELKVNTDMIRPSHIRLELTGGIVLPQSGFVNPKNVTIVADLSSEERPKCCYEGSPPACCPWRFMIPASVLSPHMAASDGLMVSCRRLVAFGTRWWSVRH